jgi:plasmid stabilization system protein ParE
MKLEILPAAEDELAAARDYYEAERSGLGLEFLTEIEALMARAAAAPLRFPLLRRSRARRALGKRFPYLVVFYVFPDRVRVIAVAHQKQRPRYWSKRT